MVMDEHAHIRNTLSAAIIAGGKSSRFGSPKALARVGARRLIDYAFDTARLLAAQVMLVYGQEDLYPDIPAERLPDALSDCGPAGGIYTALQHARQPWLAVLPCDVPLLGPEIHRLLYRHRGEERPIVLRSERGIEPLIALWPRTATGRLHTCLQQGEFALHRILAACGATSLDAGKHLPDYNTARLVNINTADDLAALRRYCNDDRAAEGKEFSIKR